MSLGIAPPQIAEDRRESKSDGWLTAELSDFEEMDEEFDEEDFDDDFDERADYGEVSELYEDATMSIEELRRKYYSGGGGGGAGCDRAPHTRDRGRRCRPASCRRRNPGQYRRGSGCR